ncbi:MAG: D-alanyl-D-alanine carboxypeptidase [Rhodospirillales bacterium CG15_BIG_FIL_POST_REV_8_21_14_020_66_15]|nr:MAG: D-alanyl-D-alanine carboxypeptidase [Rhodospirillales bacterium CG15_BIG_FIL_POST_REV_8_21_14_020_66_15]
MTTQTTVFLTSGFRPGGSLAGALLLAGALFAGAQPAAASMETIAREAILMDAQTGAVLFEKEPDSLMPPASMSKLMTVYMVFQRLKEGSLSLDEEFVVSENAWRKGNWASGGSTMFLEPGQRVRVEDLLQGIIVQSGNDACVVAAEALAGSEDAFAELMTEKGREIGLTHSTFRNASGWPHPEHRMTARDLATLARRTIRDFPEFYHYYAERKFTYNGHTQYNRNELLGKGLGVDGLKTGHTENAGYGLTASAERRDRRLILVVNGLPSKKARREEPQRLLEWGFREFKNYALFKTGEEVAKVGVWLGEKAEVPLIVKDEMVLTLPRKERAGMKATAEFQTPVPAPVKAGDRLGTLTLSFPEREAIQVPLVAGDGAERLGLFGRVMSALRSIILGVSG